MGRVFAIAVAISASVVASGCVVETVTPPARGVVVSGPPPEPMREAPPPTPGPHAAWVAGYWHWTGMQFTWIPGHWEEAPPGTRWRAPHYSMHEGTYFYEPGGWMR